MLAEIGADELPVELVLNKIDARRPAAPAAAREPLPGRAADLGARPARGSTSCGRGSPSASPSGSSSCGCSSRTTRARRSPSSTRSARRSRSATTARTASSSARGCPSASCGASRRSSSRERRQPRLARRVIELPVRRLREDAVAAGARLRRATPGSTSSPASAPSSARASGRVVGDRARRRDPRGPRRASSSRARASPPRHGHHDRQHARARSTPATAASCASIAAQHRRATSRSSSSRGCGSPSSSSLPVPERRRCVEVDELPESERGARGFGSSRALMGAEPRIRVSALLRWQRPRSCSAGTRSTAASTGCCRAAASNSGETPRRRAAPRARRGGRHRRRRSRSRGRSRSSTRSRRLRSFAAKHVVHIIFAGDLGGPVARGGHLRTTRPCAGTGSSTLDELDEVVLHPPIQRFLPRWQPGDPVVYLGAALGALDSGAAGASRARCGRRRRGPRASSSSGERLAAPGEPRRPCACAIAWASSQSASHGLRGSSGPWR